MTTITTPSSLALVPSLKTAWQDVDSSFKRFCLPAGFVELSTERLAEWMASDLSKLDLLVIQIDGLHIGNDLVLVAALGIDEEGHKHPLALIEGATENAAVVQALIDNLIERGLDPKVCRLFIIDGAKALSKVIRRTFGAHTPIQRCQIHKARNVIERLPMPLHASARRALRQAWELDDANKAERLLRNLSRRLDQEAPGVAASILEGLDEMLTVNRLGLPVKLRRSLACTNSIENMMGTVRRVCRNVKRWRNATMALRWCGNGRGCSDGFEISCRNGERVRVAFALDCCDREAMSFLATTSGVSGEDVRDLMLAAVEHRFGVVNRLPVTIKWLSEMAAVTSPARHDRWRSGGHRVVTGRRRAWCERGC